ncbi:hypothetical protein RFI_05368, partial [Reticulomyxa filosa]
KQIHFGSGGGGCCFDGSHGGSGGGIFELIIEQQLINHGSIQSNGGDSDRGGGGSGGSILIEFRCHGNTWKHTFGIIRCIGGNQTKQMKVEKEELQFMALNYQQVISKISIQYHLISFVNNVTAYSSLQKKKKGTYYAAL